MSLAMIPDARVRATLRRALLAWYDRRARRFAFRGIRDPWAILVSEVVLQQTQAARGEAAWRTFIARFPTVDALAVAAPADVLRMWSGLGYNRRAINLQRAARAIVERHGGEVPDDPVELEGLPGVGPYTARAVAAIAFGRPVGPVDTNVRRVLGRLVAGHGSPRDPGRPLPAASVQALADALVPPSRPADWTAALMDLGATVCRPVAPDCRACPIARHCRFAQRHAAATARAASGGHAGTRRRVRAAETTTPYEASSRWLRGRIMARLAAVDGDSWQRFEPPIGDHGPEAVAAALVALDAEGLVETDGLGGWRLPVA